MRPIRHAADMAMLDGVVMDVIKVVVQVAFVPDGMFPIAPLPNATLTFARSAGRYGFSLWKLTREMRLDQTPARE